MTLSSSTVFCSLVVVVAAFTGSVSALSCAQCQPEQIAKVSIFTYTLCGLGSSALMLILNIVAGSMCDNKQGSH